MDYDENFSQERVLSRPPPQKCKELPQSSGCWSRPTRFENFKMFAMFEPTDLEVNTFGCTLVTIRHKSLHDIMPKRRRVKSRWRVCYVLMEAIHSSTDQRQTPSARPNKFDPLPSRTRSLQKNERRKHHKGLSWWSLFKCRHWSCYTDWHLLWTSLRRIRSLHLGWAWPFWFFLLVLQLVMSYSRLFASS